MLSPFDFRFGTISNDACLYVDSNNIPFTNEFATFSINLNVSANRIAVYLLFIEK